jgi:cellulose synthase/poly-beta-1,6-N-acetylglucosamine synthase-like glycosyltransferase
LAYILFGYPLLLGALSRSLRRPVRKSRQQPSVSAIIAVYNGERFIADKLRSVLGLEYPGDKIEVLVASDGSSDRTDEIVGEFESQGVRLLRLPRGGKCAALNAAIAQASGEILLLTDVRQTLAPASLQLLVDCFADPAVGVVSGELVIRSGAGLQEANAGLYWRYEFWIRKQLSGIDSIFGASGSIYAMRRSLAVPLPADMLLDDVYLPLAAFFRGYRLIVEPAAQAFDFPTALETEFRRKVRTLAGNYQILAAYPALLGPRNRMWVHFVSYKLGRLLLPYLLAGLLISSFWLPGRWARVSLLAQALFYGLAALDGFIPKNSALKKISAPVRTFVVLILAAACATVILFVPPRTLWKETKIA